MWELQRREEDSMREKYVDANELVQTLGICKSKAYAIIRKLNRELEKQGYITIAGKCPRESMNG